MKITDVVTASAGPIPFLQSAGMSYRSTSPISDAASITSSSTISTAGSDDEDESIVFDHHGRIVKMDQMLYEALCGLVETDEYAYQG